MLVVVAGVGLVVAMLLGASAAASFRDKDGAVGGCLLVFACALGLGSLVGAVWGAREWYRAEEHQKPTAADTRRLLTIGLSSGSPGAEQSDPAVLRSLREMLAQPACISMLIQVVLGAGAVNFAVEAIMLADCTSIPLFAPSPWFSDPDEPLGSANGVAEYVSCPNHGIFLHLEAMRLIKPQQTVYGSTTGTALLLGFFTSLFGYGQIRRAVLGRPWHSPITGAVGQPWAQSIDDELLDRWYLKVWVTGRRSACVRDYIWVRALLVAFQLGILFSALVTLGLVAIHSRMGWDGSFRPWAYVAFKTSWCCVEAALSVVIGFAAATAETSVRSMRIRSRTWRTWQRVPTLQ